MLKRRRSKKTAPAVTCFYCDIFWTSPSRSEGRGNTATVYRRCRRTGNEVTRDSEACKQFYLSQNIQCEKFHNRMDNVCCISRARHKYGDDFCWKKCNQVAVIRSSYAKMGKTIPKTGKPDLGRLSAPVPQKPVIVQPKINTRLKRRVNATKEESAPVAKRLTRKKTKGLIKKLKRRRR